MRKKRWMDQAVSWIYERFWTRRGTRWDQKLKSQLRLLHPVSDQELTQMVRNYRKDQIRLGMVSGIILFLCLISMVLWMFLPEKEIEIMRAGYGEGERTEIIYPKKQDPIEFKVQEREYTKEELEKVFSKGFQWLKEEMLLDNSFAGEVRSDLRFPLEVPGGIKAEWISENPDVISEDGTVHNENWKKGQSKMVTITILLSWKDEIRRQEVHLVVKEPVLSSEQQLQRKIRATIEAKEQKSRKEPSFMLPSFIEGIEIKQTEAGKQMISIFCLLIVVFILIFYKKHNTLQEQIERRKKEIQEDYPLIVNKLVLYLSAGMNTKSAFEKISEEYQQDRKQGCTPFRFAYQELYVMMNQLKAGVSERKAYEEYGIRTGETTYLKLMTLIIQNLQKGSVGLLQALSEEEEKAFAQRIDRAKKQGEEVGTKLLFPMLILLIVVMLIVMLPAIFQFRSY